MCWKNPKACIELALTAPVQWGRTPYWEIFAKACPERAQKESVKIAGRCCPKTVMPFPLFFRDFSKRLTELLWHKSRVASTRRNQLSAAWEPHSPVHSATWGWSCSAPSCWRAALRHPTALGSAVVLHTQGTNLVTRKMDWQSARFCSWSPHREQHIPAVLGSAPDRAASVKGSWREARSVQSIPRPRQGPRGLPSKPCVYIVAITSPGDQAGELTTRGAKLPGTPGNASVPSHIQ